MPWINGQSGGTRIANGGGLVVVNADGSINNAPASGKTVLDGGLPGVTRPQWYGAKFDKVTDDTAAWNAAFAALYAGGGGTLECPPGTSLILGQLLVPNNGATPPRQVNMRWQGAGAHADASAGGYPSSGTVLDMRYAAANAKILTFGAGSLEIVGISFVNGGTDSAAYLMTTATTLKVHHCAFYGSPTKGRLTCDQDAIILGGTGTTNDGTVNAPYQGYGSVIEANFFDRIRRAVLGQTYCNAAVVRDNTIWNQCGSNLAGGAAIEFIGLITNADIGNVVSGNLIEMVGYPYGIKFGAYAEVNSATNNNFYDATATTLAYIRCEATAAYNLVVAGYGADTYPTLSDASATATLLTAHQTQWSNFPQPVLFTGQTVSQQNASSPVGWALKDVSANVWDQQMFVGGQPAWGQRYNGAVVMALRRLSATAYQMELQGSVGNDIQLQGTGLQQVYASNATGMLGVGKAAPATTETGGFMCIPVMAGDPTGTPSASTGYAPIVFSLASSKLFLWNGTAWKGVVLA